MAKKDETKVKKSKTTSKQRATKPKKKETKTPTQPEQPNWRQWLDTLSKGSFFLLAAIYLAGFLVVTVAYTKMGVPPPLFPVKYLSAGLVPLTIIGFAWFLVRRTLLSAEDKTKLFPAFKWFFKSITSLFTITLLVLIGLDGIFGLPSYGKPLLDLKILQLLTRTTLGFFILLPFLILLIFDFFKRFFHSRNPQLSWLFSNLEFYSLSAGITVIILIVKPGYQTTGLWIIFSMFFFYVFGPEWESNSKSNKFSLIWGIMYPSLLSILAYGAFIYPTTSPLIGGGNPPKIIIYTSRHPLYPSFQTSLDSIIPIEAELFYKTGDEYLLSIEDSLGNPHIIGIDKNKIENIRYLTPKQIKARQAIADSLEEIKKLEGEMMGPFPPDSLSPAPDSS